MEAVPVAAGPEEAAGAVAQEAALPEHPEHLFMDVITDPTMTDTEDITVITPAAKASVLPADGIAELSLLWFL